MCECGCAEGMAPVFTFEGPPGITYAVALYQGCRDCDTPAGMMLYAIPDSEREHFMLDDPDYKPPTAPWITVQGFPESWREIAIPASRGATRRTTANAFDEFIRKLPERGARPGETT